jgi:phage terminase large subunit-like protein
MLIKERTIWTPDNSFLLEYRARIECGEIIVGQELWQELRNLKEDFLNDAYFYDTRDANLRIDFMERCVRLTKSPYYNKPMNLMLWQKAFIEAVYSFKMSETTFDRFKKIILLIARKNTKSETCSALGLSELIVGTPGADIVCSSNDDNQASITYDAIDTMRQLIDPDSLDTKRNQRFILNKSNGSKIFKLSDRTRNKEGRNIDFAIIDETHEMKENVIGKSIEQSQSLKDSPKFINITTEGFVVDGYLDDELKKARAVIWNEDDGPAAQRLLPWFYTQDSEAEVWQDPSSWVKSNPTLGIVKKWDYLNEQIDLARKSKADRIFVLAKDFNLKQNAVESWLNLEDYDYKSVYDLEEMRGAICLGAVDLSETTDLTSAKVLMMKPGDSTKYIYSHYFIPESKLEDSDDANEGAKYKEWAEQGLLTITEGNDIDLAVVADWFYSLYTQYNIRLWKCGYDQKFAKDWITRMGFYGWQKTGGDESDLILIQQNAQTLSNAIRLCEADFKHKLINYNDNAVDKWCFGNACLKLDNLRQCLIVKAKPSQRIDGAVSLAILYEMYRRYRTDFKTMVEGAA